MFLCKKIVMRFLLMSEIVLFLGNFLYAESGLSAILALQRENEHASHEIQSLKDSLIVMEEQLLQWNRDPYYKEKIAREQLHMIRSDEIVYFNL